MAGNISDVLNELTTQPDLSLTKQKIHDLRGVRCQQEADTHAEKATDSTVELGPQGEGKRRGAEGNPSNCVQSWSSQTAAEGR